MNNVWKVARREIKSYFVSPTGYIILSLFSVLTGWFFFNHLSRFNQLVVYYSMSRQAEVLNQINLNSFVIVKLFNDILMLLNIFLPAVTMRLIAEEKKQSTIELLFTSPLTTAEIVFGKYLSVLIFFAIMLALTLIYPIILFVFGSPGPELFPIITGYFGLFLVGACILSVGVFASSLTENQIVAFILALSISLLFYIIHLPAPSVGGALGDVLNYLSLQEQFSSLANGFFDSRVLVYYISFCFSWLFLTHRTLEGLRIR